jgi:glyoxylase-like metal-dependent hydrolase (beta-lactamase superfamily II)
MQALFPARRRRRAGRRDPVCGARRPGRRVTLGGGSAPEVTGFFDPETCSVSYVVRDPGSASCAIIDPVLDFDPAAGRIGHASADRIAAFVDAGGLTVEWLIETHVHADHLTAGAYLRERLGGRLGVGALITVVRETFGEVFNAGPGFPQDGRQFDALFGDGDSYAIGALTARVIHTPGHTPACATHLIGDAAFVGDTLFMPDVGTARADFPGGDARTLYRSIRRILALAPATRLFTGHDYPPNGRGPRFETTVAAQRAGNIHVRDGVGEDAFVRLRMARDATLAPPRLIIPAIQVNINAGALPEPEPNGRRYLKIPIDTF